MSDTAQVLLGGGNDTPSVSATEYAGVSGGLANGWGTRADRQQTLAGPCTARNFLVWGPSAPGSGKSYTFTIMKGGTATAIEVVISDTSTKGQDTVNTEDFVLGDEWSVRCTPSGTPPSIAFRWAIEIVVPTTKTLIMGTMAPA